MNVIRFFDSIINITRSRDQISAKLRKNKKAEENDFFINTWREETCLWDVTSTAYKNRDAKFQNMKVLMEKYETRNSCRRV